MHTHTVYRENTHHSVQGSALAQNVYLYLVENVEPKGFPNNIPFLPMYILPILCYIILLTIKERKCYYDRITRPAAAGRFL